MVVQRPRLHAPNVKDLSSALGQGIRSHIAATKKTPHAAMKMED